MTIDLSYISQSRVAWIAAAESVDQATSMGILDRLIDKIFRGGAKEESIREIYSAMVGIGADSEQGSTANKMQNFLDLRNLIRPDQRDKLTLEFNEYPDNSCDYVLRLDGHTIYERKEIHANTESNDNADLIALHNTRKAMEVDDFLVKLQGGSPQSMSLIHRCDRFLVEQGKVGDCYALATMIGIMSNPEMQGKIQNMAEIIEDDKLRLTLNVDFSAANIKNAGPEYGLDQETLGKIFSDKKEIDSLRSKGYDVLIKDDTLRLDISKNKLKSIMVETKSAQTNSLIVNILEHFSGNFLARLEKDTASPEKNLSKDGRMLEIDSEVHRVRDTGVRSRRNSITAHDDRAGNYDPLLANLLGYAGGARSTDPEDTQSLMSSLKALDDNKRCLCAASADGFTYVSIQYGKPDKDGRLHSRHALVLHSVEYNSTKEEPTAAYLINPWDNSKAPERYSLNDLLARNISLAEYYPAGGKSAFSTEASIDLEDFINN